MRKVIGRREKIPMSWTKVALGVNSVFPLKGMKGDEKEGIGLSGWRLSFTL